MVKAYDWIAYHANQTPDRMAQVDLHSGRRYTYQQMNTRCAQLAGSQGRTFSVVTELLLSNNSTDCLDTQFACMKLGAACTAQRLAVPELEYSE